MLSRIRSTQHPCSKVVACGLDIGIPEPAQRKNEEHFWPEWAQVQLKYSIPLLVMVRVWKGVTRELAPALALL